MISSGVIFVGTAGNGDDDGEGLMTLTGGGDCEAGTGDGAGLTGGGAGEETVFQSAKNPTIAAMTRNAVTTAVMIGWLFMSTTPEKRR
jgi:hypothetical protein